MANKLIVGAQMSIRWDDVHLKQRESVGEREWYKE